LFQALAKKGPLRIEAKSDVEADATTSETCNEHHFFAGAAGG